MELDKDLIKKARDLQEFFIGTYAEEALEAALQSGNSELLRLAVQEYMGARQLMEEI